MLNRRRFLATGSVAVAAASLSTRFQRQARAESVRYREPSELRTLAAVALDVARRAGATYAEVHFTTELEERWQFFMGTSYPAPMKNCQGGVAVRALMKGYWGFASRSGHMVADDMASLGREAAAQAKIGTVGKPRTVDLASTPVVADGVWTMPVEVDPFTMPWEEKADFMGAMGEYFAQQKAGVFTMTGLQFAKRTSVFVSSEGTCCTQTVYGTQGGGVVQTVPDFLTGRQGFRMMDLITTAGLGWEYIRDMPFRDNAARLIEESERSRRPVSVETGRFDVVFNAAAMAAVLNATIAPATQLDRAMGYRANDEGTSFLNNPLDMLGTQRIGGANLTVSANRSLPGGSATVRWDAEGVAPPDTTLVSNGLLTNFQTTRESASWLAPYYQRIGTPVQSSGGAHQPQVTGLPVQSVANLRLHAGPDDVSFDDMVRDVKHGYAILGGSAYTDQQCLNGTGGDGGLVYLIRDGKLADVVEGASYLFRAPEFWAHVDVFGGPRSVRHIGFGDAHNGHTISAVPAKASNVAMVDARRRA